MPSCSPTKNCCWLHDQAAAPRHPDHADHDGDDEQPAEPGVAAGRARRVADGLGVLDRIARDREADLVGDLRADRLQLTGVAGAVAAEQAAAAGTPGPAGAHVRGRAHEQRACAGTVVGVALDHVGHQAGDVVGAARPRGWRGPARRRRSRASRWRGCRPADRRRGRRSRRRCTAAAGRRAASSRTNRSGSRSWMPSMARRMRLRCGCTRASSSVIRPSSMRVCTKVWSVVSWLISPWRKRYARLSPTWPMPTRCAVEQRDGGGGAGAVERGVLVDQLGDPVVGAVQRVADQAEQVGLARVGAGRVVLELAQLGDRGAGGDVAARRAADPVADGDQVRSDVPGVLVVLADATHVGDRGVSRSAQVGSRSLPQLEDRLADADLGAEGDRGRLGDPDGADVGAVGRAEVLDEPLVAGGGDPRVPGADVVVVEPDRRVAAAADEDRCLVELGALADVAALGDDDVGRAAAALRRRLLAPPSPCGPRRRGPPRAPARRTCRSGSPRSRRARRSTGSPGRRP